MKYEKYEKYKAKDKIQAFFSILQSLTKMHFMCYCFLHNQYRRTGLC